MRALFHHPSLKCKTMAPLAIADETQVEENIRIAEEAIKHRGEFLYSYNRFSDFKNYLSLISS